MIHLDILDEERKKILPLLSKIKQLNFYLAGGTALALQLGHRDSIDFDFFREGSFDTKEFFKSLSEIFSGYKINLTQDEEDTLSLELNEAIKFSFFRYNYPLINELNKELEFFPLASITDIGCMKLAAIRDRAVLKDYVDLYYILKNIDLITLIEAVKNKYPSIDPNIFLKGMTYTDDVLLEKVDFKKGYEIDLKTINNFLNQKVKQYYLN